MTGTPTDAELAACALHGGPRRDEWIAGRVAMRRALIDVFGARAERASVLIAPDGAPLVIDAPPCGVSLSHDGEWIAVAIAEGAWRVGIDLCLHAHAERAARILGRLGVDAPGIAPCVQWAALEATLKLRRLPVMALREHALEIRGRGGLLEVHGLGDAAIVERHDEADFVVAWAGEALA